MLVTFQWILTLAFFASISAYPSAQPSVSDRDVEPVSSEKHSIYGDQPIIDTGIIGEGSLSSSPFDGFFETFTGLMSRVRQQMESFFNRSPGTGDIGTLPFPNIPELDLSKGNTTSVTKIVDGHKVVINETEYKQEGDLGGTFFRVRVVDVRPDSDEQLHSREEVDSFEKSLENEIPKINSNENGIAKALSSYENLESLDENDLSAPHEYFHKTPQHNFVDEFDKNMKLSEIIKTGGDHSLNFEESFEDSNSIQRGGYHDLSNDTNVNIIAEQNGVTPNPDAEVFSVPVRVPPNNRYYPRWEPVKKV